MQKIIRFGPAGNSESFYAQGNKSSWQAPEWLSRQHLTAYEYPLGRGISLKPETAATIRAKAEEHNIQLSMHLPYFINLATDQEEKIAKNIAYFLESAAIAKHLGAVRGIFHAGSGTKHPRDEALALTCTMLKHIMGILDDQGYSGFTLCPETMGKYSQLGNLDEIMTLCELDERIVPCLDFGHLNCLMQGALSHEDDYAHIFDRVEECLGKERADNLHIHFSKIEFTAAGEKRHRKFEDLEYGPEFTPLAAVLASRGYTPVVICESSGTMAEDAVDMQRIYQAALARKNGR